MASPTFVAKTDGAFLASDVHTTTKPTGTTTDDFLLLAAYLPYAMTAGNMVYDSGFATIAIGDSNYSSSYGLEVRQKVAGGSEPSAYDCYDSVHNAEYGRTILAAFRGVLTSAPIDAIATTVTGTEGSTTITFPSVTALSANTLLVCGISEESGAGRTFTAAGGLTAISLNPGGSPSRAMFYEAISSAGVVSGRTVTVSASSGSFTKWAILLASESAGGGSSTTPPIAMRHYRQRRN